MLVNKEYIYILAFIVTCIGLCLILLIISRWLMRHFYSRTHYGPFECGNDTFGDARRQVGLNFYNYGLSFILFDIEVLFLLPAVPSFAFFTAAGRLTFLVFVGLLVIGYRYEMKHNLLALRN